MLAAIVLAAGMLPSAAVADPPAAADPAKLRLFYFDQDFGSESQFNPATVILNVGLMAYGTLGQDPRVQDLGTDGALSRLGDAYAHPLESMRGRGSVKDYFIGEFLFGALPFAPNMYLHLLGEGMVSRKLEEFYLDRGLSPAWSAGLAVTTMVVAQQLNELNEQASPLVTCADRTRACRRLIDGADSLADSSFFNIAGLVLFRFDWFAGLFSNEYIGFHYWPGQPALDVRTGRIFNQGEVYRLTAPVPWTPVKVAFLSGAPLVFGLGLVVPVQSGHALTASWGTTSHWVPVTELNGGRPELGDYVPLSTLSTLNLHWDRDGSLMASLLARTDFKGYLLNLYPGVLDFGPAAKIGLYSEWNRDTAFAAGLTWTYLPIVPGVEVW